MCRLAADTVLTVYAAEHGAEIHVSLVTSTAAARSMMNRSHLQKPSPVSALAAGRRGDSKEFVRKANRPSADVAASIESKLALISAAAAQAGSFSYSRPTVASAAARHPLDLSAINPPGSSGLSPLRSSRDEMPPSVVFSCLAAPSVDAGGGNLSPPSAVQSVLFVRPFASSGSDCHAADVEPSRPQLSIGVHHASSSDAAPSSAADGGSISPHRPTEDLFASIESKLAVLSSVVRSDKKIKRSSGALPAKAAAGAASPRATGNMLASRTAGNAQARPSQPGATAAQPVGSPTTALTISQPCESDCASASDFCEDGNLDAAHDPHSPAAACAHIDAEHAAATVLPLATESPAHCAPAAFSSSAADGGSISPHRPTEDLFASIESKLAVLSSVVRSDKKIKRSSGALPAKAAAGAASPRATGNMLASRTAGNTQARPSQPGATAAQPVGQLEATVERASLFAQTAPASSLYSPSSSASAAVLAHVICRQSEAPRGHAVAPLLDRPSLALALPPPTSPAPHARHSHPSPEQSASAAPSPAPASAILSPNAPPSRAPDVFTSIEANLLLLSSVVVPPQFKKRALGTRLPRPAAAGRSNVALPSKSSTIPAKSSVKNTVLPPAAAATTTAAAAAGTHPSYILPNSNATASSHDAVQPEASTASSAAQPPVNAGAEHAMSVGCHTAGGGAGSMDAASETVEDFVRCAAADDGAESYSSVTDSSAVQTNIDPADPPTTSPPPTHTTPPPTTSPPPTHADPPPSTSPPPTHTAPPPSPFGLVLERQKSGMYVVTAVAASSPASAQPRLKSGAVVVELNGLSCPTLQPAQVESMLQGDSGGELRVTVKKGWLWGTAAVVLKAREQHGEHHAAAASSPTSVAASDENNAAHGTMCLEQCDGNPFGDLSTELLSRAAVAVAASELAARGGDGGGGGVQDFGGEEVAAALGDGCGSEDRVAVSLQCAASAEGLAQTLDDCCRPSECRSSDIVSAVERNLALLNDRLRLQKQQQQQQQKQQQQQQQQQHLSDCLTTLARAHVTAAAASRAAQTPLSEHAAAACVGAGGGDCSDSRQEDDSCGDAVESSIHLAMRRRLGDSLPAVEAQAAAAVAQAAISSASRQKAVEEREQAERTALAAIVARQSALTLEARAVVAGNFERMAGERVALPTHAACCWQLVLVPSPLLACDILHIH
jgi:hypothetical protein